MKTLLTRSLNLSATKVEGRSLMYLCRRDSIMTDMHVKQDEGCKINVLALVINYFHPSICQTDLDLTSTPHSLIGLCTVKTS